MFVSLFVGEYDEKREVGKEFNKECRLGISLRISQFQKLICVKQL